MFNNLFLNRVVHEMCENTAKPDRPQMTIWLLSIACWIPKATNTLSEYIILTAFPLQHGYAKAPQCYVIRTLTVLFVF
jgi:hypothetical protein